MTKKVLIIAALAEGGFGLLLVAYPPIVARLLFDSEVGGIGTVFGRMTGACLIALAVACWPIGDGRSASYGMLTWSVLALLYLLRIGIRGVPVGPFLWPAVIIHAALIVLLVVAGFKARESRTT
jgi:hypothetical protein